MGHPEGISLDEVRANHYRSQLRQRLHERFAGWLDTLEQRLSPTAMSCTEITDALWELRQSLMGSLTQTVVEPTHECRVQTKPRHLSDMRALPQGPASGRTERRDPDWPSGTAAIFLLLSRRPSGILSARCPLGVGGGSSPIR